MFIGIKGNSHLRKIHANMQDFKVYRKYYFFVVQPHTHTDTHISHTLTHSCTYVCNNVTGGGKLQK